MKIAKEFRESARNALRGKWWDAVAAGLLASLLGALSSTSSVSFGVNSDVDLSLPLESIIPQEQLGIFYAIMATALGIITALSIVFFILGSIVLPGYAKFNLDLIDGEKPRISTLFDYFKHWKKALGANLLRNVYTFLWSLLFIIPGIIAALKYAMVPYIVAEDPEISPKEALEKSKAMMYGNKWRLFCLELSFIGWTFLCAFTFGIGFLWLIPYQQAAYADFYREISGTRVGDVTLEVVDETFEVAVEAAEEINEEDNEEITETPAAEAGEEEAE